LFDYKDGELFWKNKTSPFSNIKIGQKAGCFDKYGYIVIYLNKKQYGAHRLIFMMHYGYIPQQIDHSDNNPSNNCIENLREATISQNMQNAIISKRNNSGIKGVNFDKKSISSINLNKKLKSLYTYT
jgi:hypothetical protein